MKQASKPAAILTGLLLVITWVVVIAITVPQAQSIGPQPNGDYGFFTAVAERLVAGDRLYVDIWDNKDPFVFYTIAVARSAGIWGAWTLELLWILTAAIAVWLVARWAAIPRTLGLVAAGVSTPLVIVGLPYFMGSTHVPGIALTLAAVAATLRSRPVLVGILIVTLTFFKLIMLPLVLIAVAAAVLMRSGRWSVQGLGSFVKPLAMATGVTLVAVLGLLAIRGELVPYFDAQIANVLYSQAPIVPETNPSLIRWIARHVVTLVNPHVLAILIASAATLSAARITRRRSWAPPESVLWWLAASTVVVEIAIVAAVSKWLHHALILAVSSSLVIVLIAFYLTRARWGSGLLGVLALVAITYPLMGAPNPSVYLNAVTSMPTNISVAQQSDRASAALKELSPSSVAFIGQGNLAPRSFKLTDWTLSCRHIAQRHFDSPRNFTETLECLPGAATIVISPDAEQRDGFDEYNEFLISARVLAEQGRACQEIDTFIVCEK